jgi:hypothetical protein
MGGLTEVARPRICHCLLRRRRRGRARTCRLASPPPEVAFHVGDEGGDGGAAGVAGYAFGDGVDLQGVGGEGGFAGGEGEFEGAGEGEEFVGDGTEGVDELEGVVGGDGVEFLDGLQDVGLFDGGDGGGEEGDGDVDVGADEVGGGDVAGFEVGDGRGDGVELFHELVGHLLVARDGGRVRGFGSGGHGRFSFRTARRADDAHCGGLRVTRRRFGRNGAGDGHLQMPRQDRT